MDATENIALDEHQQAAWDSIRRGHNVLVTGPAGTGKSALLRHIMAQLDADGIPYALAAMTGQAAELIGGATLHSCFGWSKQQAVGDFEIAETRRRWLQALQVLIIDECSMLSAEFLQYLVEAITRMRSESQEEAGGTQRAQQAQQAATQEQQQGQQQQQQQPRPPVAPLAGLQLVLVGDFHQLPPVVRPAEFRGQQEAAGIAMARALRSAATDRSSLAPEQIKRLAPYLNRRLAFESGVWQDLGMRVHQLSLVHRQRDGHFVAILHALRAGHHTPAQLAQLRALARPLDVSDGILPTELHSTNGATDTINRRELERLQARAVVYTSVDSVTPESYPEDPEGQAADASPVSPAGAEDERWRQVQAMRPRVLGEDRKIAGTLELKQGAQVMLCANLSRDPYLVNGSRGVVVGYIDGSSEQAMLEDELSRLQAQLQQYEQGLGPNAQPYMRAQRAAGRPGSAAQQPVQPPQQQQQQQPEQPAEAKPLAVPGPLPAAASSAPAGPSDGAPPKTGLSQFQLLLGQSRRCPGQQPSSRLTTPEGSSRQQPAATGSPSVQRMQRLRLDTPGEGSGATTQCPPAAGGGAGGGAGAASGAGAEGCGPPANLSPYKRRLDFEQGQQQRRPRLAEQQAAEQPEVMPSQGSAAAAPPTQQRQQQQ